MFKATGSVKRTAGFLTGRPIWFVTAGFVTMFLANCSTTSSGTDVSPDLPMDIAADAGNDTVADTTQDAASDAIEDTASDAIDAAAEVAPDVPVPFHWAAGCEAPGTRDAWTSIPATDAAFLRGPLVQMADRDGATMVWRMAVPSQAEGCVDFSWSGLQRTVCGPADANGQYEIPVIGLPVATEITYAVRVGETHTPPLTFRTMPDRPVPMKFAIFADAHNTEESLRNMSQIALAEGVDFAIGVGDLTGSGQVEEFDQTFRGFRDLGTRVNIWAVIGNHDEKNIQGYLDAFVLPQGNLDEAATGQGEDWWSGRIGNVWIGGGYIRDFYFSTPESDWGEVGWFLRQFQTEEFQTAQWKLFFIHEPPWVASGGGDCVYYGENSLRVALMPMLAAAGVQASFHGHMHGVEWGDVEGVRTYVAGGLCDCGLDSGSCPVPDGLPQPWNKIYGHANFAIVETGCDGLTVRYLGLDGTELARDEIPATPIGTIP